MYAYGWGNRELVCFQGMYMWYIKLLLSRSSYHHVVCVLSPPSIFTLCPAVGVLVNCWFRDKHKKVEWGRCSVKTGSVKRRCEEWVELIGLRLFRNMCMVQVYLLICRYLKLSLHVHSFIPLACAECDDSLSFSGASSIPLCYVLFPATLLCQLFFHPLSPQFAIYFLVYLLILLFPNSYISPTQREQNHSNNGSTTKLAKKEKTQK